MILDWDAATIGGAILRKAKRAKADACLDTREVSLEAPAETPSPLRDAYEAIARTLFAAWGLRRNSPKAQSLFEQDVRSLSQAWKASRKKYQAVEIFLQAEAHGRCAHQEALNVIMRVNDACGHVMNGYIPFLQAVNHLKKVPPFDLARLLKEMRRQASRAALRFTKTDRDNPTSENKQSSDQAKLISHEKQRLTKGKRDSKLESRDQWIYGLCCRGLSHKKIIGQLNVRCPKEGWDRINSVQGVRAAAIRYAERHDLPKPASRKNL